MLKNRLLRVGAVAVMVGLLSTVPALAATHLDVDGSGYEGGAAASGEGWTWDGADEMGLNGYDGGSIVAFGDLNITLTGSNTITADQSTQESLTTYNGDLSIQGTGSLDIETGQKGDGLYADGNLSIDDATVTVNAGANNGSRTDFVSATEDINLNNATLTVSAEDTDDYSGGIRAEGNLNIKDSTVDVTVTRNFPITSEGDITIDNSHVHAVIVDNDIKEAYAVLSLGKITLNNVQGDITVRDGEVWWGTTFPMQYLTGPDENVHDILIDPIPQPEEKAEEAATAPAAAATVLPATGDAVAMFELVAACGSLLSGAAIALRRKN